MIITQEEKIISQKLSIFTSVASVLRKTAMLLKLIIVGGEGFYKRYMRYLNSELYLFTAHVWTDQH